MITQSVIATEYIRASVTASVSLDEQVVKVAFVPSGTNKGNPDLSTEWTAATWQGSAATTRTWQLLVGPTGDVTDLSVGTYNVWSQIFDTPESPVLQHGQLQVI